MIPPHNHKIITIIVMATTTIIVTPSPAFSTPCCSSKIVRWQHLPRAHTRGHWRRCLLHPALLPPEGQVSGPHNLPLGAPPDPAVRGAPAGEESLAPGLWKEPRGLEDITRLSAGGRRAEFRRGSRRQRAGGGDGPTTKRALFCAPPGSWNQWIGGS